MVDKTAGTLAETKPVAPDCTGVTGGAHCPARKWNTEKSGFTEERPWQRSKNNFITSPPLSIHLLNILYDEMQSNHKVFLLHTKVQQLCSRKALRWLFSSKLI